MSEQELDPKVVAASTRSIMIFLERPDTQLFPKTLPEAEAHGNTVHFKEVPKLSNDAPLPQDVPSPDGWKMERSAEYIIDGFTWFSIGTFRGDGTQVGKWTSPICIKIGRDGVNGADGKPGEDGYNGTDGADGADIEYIFKLVDTEEDFYALVKPTGRSDKDDDVPTGWTDHPTGISSEHRIEAMCYREKRPNRTTWSDFNGPYIWSQWGMTGKDGDGVEYVFRLATLATDTEDGEAYYDAGTGTYHLNRDLWPPTDQAAYNALTPAEKEAFDKNEYYPAGWVDDPQSVSDAKPVQFVSSRKYDGDNKKWGFFSVPKCWNKIPLMDVNVTAFTSFSFAVTTKDISNIKPTGGIADDPDPDDMHVDGETITWHDSIPNDMIGYVWMTTGTWKDGELTDDGWSYPMKVNDSPGFQAEYSNNYPWNDDPRPKLPNFGAEGIVEDEAAWRHAAEVAGCGVWKDCRSDDPDDYIEDPTYMATCQKKDGAWTDWVVTKIKGENGLSPVELHILNDSISVAVDDDNRTWMTTANRVSIEMQRDAENFKIDPAKVQFFNQSGGEIPSEITFTDQESRENQRWYDITINVPEGMTLLQPLLLGVRIQSSNYDASAIIEIIPLHSSDGCHWELKFDASDINRFYSSTGTCLYEPNPFYCYAKRTVGANPPEDYGKIVFSTSLVDGGSKYKIGDIYTEKEGVIDYNPETGIILDELDQHESLQAIFVYMIDEDEERNIVLDKEKVEIDTRGGYELSTSVSQIKVINGDTLIPDDIEVDVWYSVREKGNKSLVTNHNLHYYFNGDAENTWVSDKRNNQKITVSQLQGFTFENLSSISFVLKTEGGEILTNPVTISFVTDGKNGISISDTLNFFKAGKQTPAETAPPSTHTVWQITHNDGWSETQVDLDDSNPVLWQFIRIEYDDDSAKHLAAFPCRYFNQQANITYDQINTLIQDELNVNLEEAINRLETVEATDALINKYPDKGLIKLLTSYKNSDGSKSFADFTANAANATIANIVGSTINDTTTTAGQKIDGIDGKVTTFAEQLKGVDQVEGAVQQLATNAITQAVSKSHYVWKVKDSVTLPDGQSKYLPYTSDDDSVDKTLYEKALVSDAMSTIKIEADKISLLTGTDGNFKAGIQIIANAANTEPIIDPYDGHTIPSGSVIVLDASNVVINGGLSAAALQAQQGTIQNLVAGTITTDKLETGNTESGTGVGALIESGHVEIYKDAVKRAEFGIDDYGDLVLKFFNSAGTEMYNLGPAGFTDPSGNPVYDNTW